VIPGAGKVIIIAHGNYRTVYTNLQEVYVKKGDQITTKQKIGLLLPTTSGKTSTAHFEIHVIKDGSVSKLNPSLWIAK
jgi:murein DD-endopeptidase MepM/ murein hydrolase activator NlpD